MSNKFDHEFPYKVLGDRLKSIRQKNRQTIAEVSEAVELDMDAYVKIEQGTERPSEDVLYLLASYFEINDSEAKSLYRLARFEEVKSSSTFGQNSDDSRTMVLSMAADLRIIYTDMAHVVANKHGIVVNFMQESGLGGQPMIASRLGMSKENAQNIINTLQNALKPTDIPKKTKYLPAPKSRKKAK